MRDWDHAPSDPEYLIDFLNTVDLEHGTDVLDETDGYASWCASRGVSSASRTRDRGVRDALRRAVAGTTAGPRIPLKRSLRVRLGPDGVVLAGDSAGSRALAAASRLTTSGDWPRVRICPGDECGEAFFDRSRNRSRVWCDMSVCGNVAKVRANRTRRRSADAPSER